MTYIDMTDKKNNFQKIRTKNIWLDFCQRTFQLTSYANMTAEEYRSAFFLSSWRSHSGLHGREAGLWRMHTHSWGQERGTHSETWTGTAATPGTRRRADRLGQSWAGIDSTTAGPPTWSQRQRSRYVPSHFLQVLSFIFAVFLTLAQMCS